MAHKPHLEVKFGPDSDFKRRTIYLTPMENVQTTAYLLWEGAGKPAGRELDFWLRAEKQHRGHIIIPDEEYGRFVEMLIEHGQGELRFQDNCIADIKKYVRNTTSDWRIRFH